MHPTNGLVQILTCETNKISHTEVLRQEFTFLSLTVWPKVTLSSRLLRSLVFLLLFCESLCSHKALDDGETQSRMARL